MSGPHKVVRRKLDEPHARRGYKVRSVTEYPRWKVIIFYKGKRHYKLCWQPETGQKLVKQLAEKGVKAHLVCRRFPKFPPKGEPDDPDKMWCPYCRRWRYFSIPPAREPFTELEIKCCQWCTVSEDDAFVKTYNGTWRGKATRRKRPKRKRR